MMNMNTHKHFHFNYRDVLIDEIALNGLEGIGFDLLWKHVEKRISSPITDKLKKRFWECIANSACVSFYQVPEPIPLISVNDRFMIVDENSGQLLDPPDYLDGPYEYHPVENEYGSCANYDTRRLLDRNEICSMTYEDVLEKYRNHFVMVASTEERWHAIGLHMPCPNTLQLTPLHYCILELIGKGRENGQMTVGKTNLTKIVKESKLLFYNRKHLQKLDLIRVQCLTQITQGRGIKSLLLRLKRFHQIRIMSMPKVGKLHKLTEYLLKKPDYSERCDVVMRKGLMTQQDSKKLKKTINIFRFTDKEVDEPSSSSSTEKKRSGPQKRKFISLAGSDQESSQSDDENNEEPLESQYTVGVNLLRQAYEKFLEAGLKGLTQVEMAKLLGIEFYTSRTICRSFRAKNIVREFLEDKGRQRTARFIAVAATAEMDNTYAEEKNKLLQHFINSEVLKVEEDSAKEEEDDIPAKKVKLEEADDNKNPEDMEDEILEVKVLDGLQNFNHESLLKPKKSLSLRQLRFANGLLKVIKDKQAVSGYQTLSALVSEITGEPPMDTKALKFFVQKLVTDRQLKILKIKWPGFLQKYSILICAPHIKPTSPVIKEKYKDICVKSVLSKKAKIKHSGSNFIMRHLSQFAYPRYMKIQKLHELITHLVYFNSVKSESVCFPHGVSSLLTILPEMTIACALGNISNVGSSDIGHLKVSDDLLKVQLREAPPDLYKAIIQSKSLQNSVRNSLKVLAQLGLVQFLPSLSEVQNAKQNVFYVNRHARIIDTTGEWPREHVDLKALEKKYYFETVSDVKNYWGDVYSISINTDIVAAKRERHIANTPVRKESELQTYDIGEIHGDGLGPCGFHSSVFMDIPRLWNTLYLRNYKNLKTRKPRPKLSVKSPKVEKLKISQPSISKKRSRKPIIETKPNEKSSKGRHSDMHVKWSTHDDEIIIICKAAITIMSPNSQAGCLKVKNITARTLLSLKDPQKTCRICHRRALLLESNPKYAHKKECILNELRCHRNLLHKYEDILKKLKIRYCAHMSKFINEGRLFMLELVWIICQILKKGIQPQTVPCVALDYNDFHNKYSITSSSINKCNVLYKTPVGSDPEFATLKEGIILTIMLSCDKELGPQIAKEIYSIFEIYPEETLRSAIEQLRKSGALAAREKVMNNQMNRIQFNDIVRSAYKISANYRRKWAIRLNADFAKNLIDIMESEVSQTSVKGTPGINCVLFEMQSCDVLDIISATVPVIVGSTGSAINEEQLNVIDIEMKFKLKSGVAGWRPKMNVKKFCEIYENCSYEKKLILFQSTPVIKFCDDQILDLQDPIISYLNGREEKGSTYRELQEHLGCDSRWLISKLSDLDKKRIVIQVGYYENRVVLCKFGKPWLFNINTHNGTFVTPRPWLMLNLELRHDILIKWSGVIMNKVFESPGCSITYLSEHTEYLTATSIQEICVFLEKFECVKLKNIELRVVDLYSEDDYVPELTDFNQYDSPDNILVFPVKNSLTKYCYLRKKILDIAEADS